MPHRRSRRQIEPARHSIAERHRSLVQLDCCHIGWLAGTKGWVWQYTATGAHSAFLWAELHVTPLDPSAVHTSTLVRRVAGELSAAGWKLAAVSTDNGAECKSHQFRQAVADLGEDLRFIHAGRPQSNGCVGQVQKTILDECWRPSFARSPVPKYTALRRNLVDYLGLFNFERAHDGRYTRHRTPAELVYGARKDAPEVTGRMCRENLVAVEASRAAYRPARERPACRPASPDRRRRLPRRATPRSSPGPCPCPARRWRPHGPCASRGGPTVQPRMR